MNAKSFQTDTIIQAAATIVDEQGSEYLTLDAVAKKLVSVRVVYCIIFKINLR